MVLTNICWHAAGWYQFKKSLQAIMGSSWWSKHAVWWFTKCSLSGLLPAIGMQPHIADWVITYHHLLDYVLFILQLINFNLNEDSINMSLFLKFSSDYRYNGVASDQMAATTQAQQVNGFIPGWMLWAKLSVYLAYIKAYTLQKDKAMCLRLQCVNATLLLLL